MRSKRFLEIPSKINLKWKTAEISNYHEDGFLCVQSRHLLENNGIKFAPFELALKFGREYSFKENLNFNPILDFNSLDDLTKIPILSKDNAKLNYEITIL